MIFFCRKSKRGRKSTGGPPTGDGNGPALPPTRGRTEAARRGPPLVAQPRRAAGLPCSGRPRQPPGAVLGSPEGPGEGRPPGAGKEAVGPDPSSPAVVPCARGEGKGAEGGTSGVPEGTPGGRNPPAASSRTAPFSAPRSPSVAPPRNTSTRP